MVALTIVMAVAAMLVARFWPAQKIEKPWPFRWRLPKAETLVSLPTAWRFDWPIGSTHGGLTYNAQPFGVRDVSPHPHLGDDLNGCYGYNTDLGDPVRAVASGLVIGAGYAGHGWGNVVAVLHAMPPKDGREERSARWYIQSFYGHLEDVLVKTGDVVLRGQQIGTIGTADGLYYAHLHFEMRRFMNAFVGPGYRENLAGWVNPTEFLVAKRGAAESDVMQEIALIQAQARK